jgi:uncharacterized protein YdeI (YjbR/CyaY-like superfamily)
MPTTDPRVDAYIDKSAEFAKPILLHLRKIVHQACPEAKETMKWSFPHFDYKGMLCGMASFKRHCAFGFWKQSLMEESNFPQKKAMGSLGRITSLDDLPDDKTLTAMVKEAVKLNDEGVKVKKPAKTAEKKELVVPDDLRGALLKNKKANETFDKFTYSHRKEYIEWIEEAKTDATREKRLATTIEWLSEGKARNWKYQRK